MTTSTLPKPVDWGIGDKFKAGILSLIAGLILMFATLNSNLFDVIVSNTTSVWETQGASGCIDQYGVFDAFIPGMRANGDAHCNRGGFVPGTNVIDVTNLNTSGPGSFREALEAGCPKVILFDVAGHVDFGIDDSVRNAGTLQGCDQYSIVGASAPGQFAMTAGDLQAALKLGGDQATIDHFIATTHGRGPNVTNQSQSRDAMSIGWQQGGHTSRLIINSAMIWGWDEDFQCYDQNLAQASNGTVLWQSIVGLGGGEDADQPGNRHQYGQINQWMCLQQSNIRTVYIHANGRTPFTRADGLFHSNNISFNSGFQNLASQPCGSNEITTYRVNVSNNLALKGPDSTYSNGSTWQFQQATCKTGTVAIYEEGNATQDAVTQSIADCTNHGCATLGSGNNWVSTPDPYVVATGYVPETFDPSSDAEITTFANRILTHVGPRPSDRLSYIQTRVINAIQAGLAGNVGGMGTYLNLGQTTMDDEGGFAVLNSNTGTWDASAQCGGMPTGAAADAIGNYGLTELHNWVLTCHYDNVMPVGWRKY